MSSLTLPSQSFRPAQPLAGRAAARALSTVLATLRGAFAGAMSRLDALTLASDARALRELAELHRSSNPGYAADLAAAADRHEAAVKA